MKRFMPMMPKMRKRNADSAATLPSAGSDLQDRADEHRHPGDPLERAERAERAHGSDGVHVAERLREEDGQPRERDDHKVELAPRVANVGVLVPDETVGEHLHRQLEGEDVEVDPLEDGEDVLLRRARGVHRARPRHRDAVAHDRQEDEGVEDG